MIQGKVDTLLGIVFGDEGKGKVVDFFTPRYDVIARFAGGCNAGHTIINDYGRFALHLLPSGVFSQNITNVIGNGVAFDVPKFAAELKSVTESGVPDFRSKFV